MIDAHPKLCLAIFWEKIVQNCSGGLLTAKHHRQLNTEPGTPPWPSFIYQHRCSQEKHGACWCYLLVMFLPTTCWCVMSCD